MADAGILCRPPLSVPVLEHPPLWHFVLQCDSTGTGTDGMNGVPFVRIQPTLLSMVDVSLDEKTAIDTPQGNILIRVLAAKVRLPRHRVSFVSPMMAIMLMLPHNAETRIRLKTVDVPSVW